MILGFKICPEEEWDQVCACPSLLIIQDSREYKNKDKKSEEILK